MFKKSHLFLSFLACIFVSFFCFDFISANEEKLITQNQANNILEKVLDKNFSWLDAKYKQIEFLKKLSNKLENISEKSQNIRIFSQVLENKIVDLEIQLSGVQKVVVWYSEELKEIYGYYKWDIWEDFLLIVANSHGAYEYGTYLTALDLIQYLRDQGKSQWFIIPTLNPDGLQVAIDDNFSKWFYLQWRWNKNDVDINRNFCTKNYSNGEYLKFFWGERKLLSKWEMCWDQLETKVIDNIFRYFSFSNVLDIHSLWWIIFVPDGWFNDSNTLNFADTIQQILWKNYEFNSQFSNNYQKNLRIQRYEFDEWGKNIFTGVLAQYIYETYNIPAIILELEYHGRVEEKLRWIEKLLK